MNVDINVDGWTFPVRVPDDVAEAWDTFWKRIIQADGSWNFRQVLCELADYYHLIQEVPKVYCEITGGLLSKTNYPAETIIRVAEEYYERRFEEDRDEWFADEYEQIGWQNELGSYISMFRNERDAFYEASPMWVPVYRKTEYAEVDE